MKVLKKYAALVVVFVISSADVSAGCDLKTSDQLLESFKLNHPGVVENKALLKVSDKWVDIAKQRANPKLQAQAMRGEEIDGDFNRVNLSLMHTFELGSKRSSRINYADSRRKQMDVSVRGSNEDILIDAIMKAYRLRQVYELIPLYEEAHQALHEILKIKQRRRSLSPEEQVEKETLVLATNDYRLKVARLKSEKISLNRHLSYFIGENCRIPIKALPKVREVDLLKEFEKSESTDHYSKIQIARKTIETATRKLELERSNAYPDLRLGPAFGTEHINGKNYQSFGLALSMDLPVLNTNSGLKRLSVEEINKAKLGYQNIHKEALLDLDTWIEKYQGLRDSLRTIATRDDLEKKHSKIERLFKRGVISTALVIESHRQLIEFANTRYEFELGAVEALWNIYKINGTVLNEKI
jgi:cobalt-zinc-cadmium efflux system outer membrane protein